MGFYSEQDIELRYGDSPFEEGGSPPDNTRMQSTPAFTEADPVESAVTQPAAETVVPQPQQNTAPAPSVSEQAVETPPETSTDAVAGQAAETADGAVSEDDKKKAHEEAEAKRKAEWEARQAAKKAEEQKKIDELTAMSDDEVLAASMQRVSADTEKLTRRNMKECVAEYIQTMCIEDPAFARKTMHPRKTMIRCFQYISRKAWAYIQDELKANGIQPGPGQQGYGSDIPDDLCFQWAVDYFNDPDAKEDHEDEEEFVPKPYIGGSTSKSKGSKTAKGKTGDKKADTSKKAAAKEPSKKPAKDDSQLSLLGVA
ncbi:MAG: hypothetical protein HFF51_07390 [Lawsonibacter sp.]|nr:hypothetical protein [Lawsonibacter sp.]